MVIMIGRSSVELYEILFVNYLRQNIDLLLRDLLVWLFIMAIFCLCDSWFVYLALRKTAHSETKCGNTVDLYLSFLTVNSMCILNCSFETNSNKYTPVAPSCAGVLKFC